MIRHVLLPRLIFARWLQLGKEQGGDQGLGTWFLLWFGDMFTMAALASVNRMTRETLTLQCSRCKVVWDFKGFWADPFWMKQLERLKYMARCYKCTTAHPVLQHGNIYELAEVTVWGTTCRKCRMYVRNSFHVHDHYVCPVSPQHPRFFTGLPAEVLQHSSGSASLSSSDNSDSSDDAWDEWVANNSRRVFSEAIQQPERDIHEHQALMEALRNSNGQQHHVSRHTQSGLGLGLESGPPDIAAQHVSL
jgi:hypothetical protein